MRERPGSAIGSGRLGIALVATAILSGCNGFLAPDRGPLFAIAGDNIDLPAGCAAEVAIQLERPVSGETVSFAVDEGGAINPLQVSVGQDGVARATWRLAAGVNQLTATSSAHPDHPLSVVARGVPVAPRGYAAIGNQIYSSTTCAPHRFVGLSRPGLEWDNKEARLLDPVLAAQDFAIIHSWNSNVVRIPISQSYWLSSSKHYDPQYAPTIERLVRQARQRGLDVIIDLHASDRGDPNYSGKFELQQMADVNHTIPFWRDVANRFKDDGGVIFELFNEPNAITWDVWLKGGEVPGGAQYEGDENAAFKKPFRAAGMQQLYDAVRGTGAQNLVILGGTHWGFYLDRLEDYEVRGYNIAYASHPYDYSDKQPETWDAAFGKMATSRPVMITEFGVRTCNAAFIRRVLDYADKHGLSWMAWAYWTPPAGPEREADMCRFPALIESWDGRPSTLGVVVRDRLLSYR